MRIICPKILNWTFFATVLKLVLHILPWEYFELSWLFPNFALLTQFLKFLKIGSKNTHIFRVKDNGKTIPNKWLERSPKMRNLRRCYCLQKCSKYKKATETYRLGFNGPLPFPLLSVQRVKCYARFRLQLWKKGFKVLTFPNRLINSLHY